MSSNTIRLILLLTACAFIGVSSLSPQESCAQTRVLLLPQDTVTNFENEVRNQNQFDFVVDAQSGQLGAVTLDLLLQYDVVVVWSNNGLSDSQSIIAGDALSDYIDAGGGVVEMVFSQFSTGFDIQGRWRSENYSCISATGDNIYSGGTLGQVADINHPIMAGINSVGTSNFRTGGASLLPGAQLIASYTDGQILVATRNDKAGRVVWVGFYPSQTQQLQGDWRQLAFQAIDHAAVSFRADAGGLYTITEGTPSVTLDASRSRGDIVSFAWDLDDDGEFDDADTPEVEFDTSGLDGPAEILVKVRVTDANNETSEADAQVVVENIAPIIVSTPPDLASVNTEYAYPFIIEDPGAAFDPITYTLVEGPTGIVFDEAGTMRWTPGPDDFETMINIQVQVDDGDEGVAEQAWSLFITAPDEDEDRIPDEVDNCPEVVNVEQLDNDEDGEGDACDDDDDNDGVLDQDDNCQFEPNPDQRDNDMSEGGDACDDDDDNDFIEDEDDNCPLTTNPSQTDTDMDGVGDACANDEDRDGIPNDVDNCLDVPNTDQTNTDGDDLGDACDEDDDNDGLTDEEELEFMTDPLDPDSDNDRLSDAREVNETMTDPLEEDTDGDGLSDGEEVIDHGTNPLSADTDGDSLEDSEEIFTLGTDPNDSDTDGDGLDDGQEINTFLSDPTKFDSDNGSVGDGDEVARGTDPNNPDDDLEQPSTEDPLADVIDPGVEGAPDTEASGCACSTLNQGPDRRGAGLLLVTMFMGLALYRRRRR